MLSISSDGYLRVLPAELPSIALAHLISGMDEHAPDALAGGAMSTEITGYTEWVSVGAPALTIGWDWQMLSSVGAARPALVGEPRSNIMLVDEGRADLGHVRTAALLAGYVGTLDWQDIVLDHIRHRYGHAPPPEGEPRQ